jgi:hypothetical protein
MKKLSLYVGWYLCISAAIWFVLAAAFGTAGDWGTSETGGLTAERVLFTHFPLIALSWPIWVVLALLVYSGAHGAHKGRRAP